MSQASLEAPSPVAGVALASPGARWPARLGQGLLWLTAVYYLLQGSAATDLRGLLTGTVTQNGMPDDSGSDAVLYAAGAALLVVAVARCLYRLWIDKPGASAPAVRRFITAFGCLSLLYVLDFFTSTAEPFSYSYRWWIFAVMGAFFLALATVRLPSERQAMAELLVLCAGLQSVYAVYCYFTGTNQFLTPHFGPRTMGTFENPNSLYPLCLVSIALGAALASSTRDRLGRVVFATAAVAGVAALLLTFTRSGWVALVVMALYLAFTDLAGLPRPQGARARSWARRACVAAALVLMLGAALVRTQGQVMGSAGDRSFWGRTAIWRTAVGIFREHPLLGHGFVTYGEVQYRPEHLTPELRRYGPMNNEPKDLWLYLACEFGLAGLVLWTWVAIAYGQLYRAGRRCLPAGTSRCALLAGTHVALVGLMVASLFDTPVLISGREAASFAVVLLLALLCSAVNDACPAGAPPGSERRRRWFRRVAGAGAVGVSVGTAAILFLAMRRVEAARPQLARLAAGTQPSRNAVPLSAVSDSMLDAVVASEDGGFYEHHGVSWPAILRAMRRNLRAGRLAEGGGTVSMQTARILLLARDRTLDRKLAEILLAFQLENRLSKNEILALYLNHAYFGLGAQGVAAAARLYFGKQPRELTLGEAGFLAGVLPELPSRRDRVTPAFVRRCQARALTRLRYFFRHKYDDETIRQAQAQPLSFAWEQSRPPRRADDAAR